MIPNTKKELEIQERIYLLRGAPIRDCPAVSLVVTMSEDDRGRYAKVVTAIKETIRLMGEIDAIAQSIL